MYLDLFGQAGNTSAGCDGRNTDCAQMRFDEYVPNDILSWAVNDPQRAIPAIARSADLSAAVSQAVSRVPTDHNLLCGDARKIDAIPNESVALVLTSPPYWNLKEYVDAEGQLGHLDDYDEFARELDRVWCEAYRMLVPGGRLAIVVGDVCVPRRLHGRHLVFPLHATVQEHCRKLGFDNLAPIIWHKIANAKFEVGGGSILGKPYEPGAIVKNDIEFILFQRKPGGYRSPTLAERILSVIPANFHREWFQQIWTLNGASTREHPAPFPSELAERLIRMFSFVGDTVLDPFMGTGTTNLAASRWGRNSIGIEIVPEYYEMAKRRLEVTKATQLSMGMPYELHEGLLDED